MDPKLAYGLVRQDLRRLTPAIEPFLQSHMGLLLPAIRTLNRRPKMPRDEAKALFARCLASQESMPGHVLTHAYADPNARPINGQFDASALTVHAVPMKRIFNGQEQKGLTLDILSTRVSRRAVSIAQKRTHVRIQGHALARYYQRLHGRRNDPDYIRDLSLGVCVHLGTRHVISPEIARPLVIPTWDGAFIGVSFNRTVTRGVDNDGYALTVEHGKSREMNGITPSMLFATEFWVNTYLHDHDLGQEQRRLLGELRRLGAEASRSMLVDYASELFGDMAQHCLPSEISPRDLGDVAAVNGRIATLRADPGWGSLGRLIRDGSFREIMEQAERFRTDEGYSMDRASKFEDALKATKEEPAPFIFGM